MKNFFDLKEEDLKVLNPYDFNKALERLNNLTLKDVKDDLQYFQKKEFDFRTYEEEVSYSLKSIQFITSSKIDKDKYEYYLLKNLNDYLVDDNDFKNFDENKNKEIKKLSLEIKNGEMGQREILLIIYVNPEKLSKNIIENFIRKSKFDSVNEIGDRFYEEINKYDNKGNFRLTMKIDMKCLNTIYFSKQSCKYFFDLQSPPIFRTNFFKNKDGKREDSNCIFPFRNFEDEFANLEYRHFIIMIEKEPDLTPKDEIDINSENFDTNDELVNSLENLLKNKNKEFEKNKDKIIDFQKKTIKDLSYYFNYLENKIVKEQLKNLYFLKDEEDKNENEFLELENDKNIENINSENQVIKLFYQILALVSECILSYYNASTLLDKLLKGEYIKTIFKCRYEDFPKFFNLTLNKILDKYQNSLEEKSLKEFEEEMKNIFELLYAQYEILGLEEIWKPSKNRTLKRLQRCIITPTYILFTPYILDQGNRVLREYVKSTDETFLCNFKMDNMGSDRWDNDILVEFMKFILSKGFTIAYKNFRFFNYSQSQFRNLSCWLSTNPEEIIKKLGDFSQIKPVCKYAARISQTLTTTISTIKIPKDKIEYIDEVEHDNYKFSDGVGKISFTLAKQINDEFLKLDYIPSCFQGRFMGCKGVWTTMWDDYSGKIYYRPSQKKFDLLPDDNREFFYFELCDYSRYIQSYLNRQVILLLNALGVDENNFTKKLDDYHKKLENQKFVLSLVHYPEWNRMFNKMYSCGINRINDRLIKSLVESNLNILYSDIKNKARIYIEESAYVKGIMDEFNVLEYGEAYLHIKRDNFDLILDKKCAVAKCPCLYPGDIRLLTFRKYHKNNIATKKYEIFNRYENVIIFPSKGKRPHPNECSGSDLDGDDYFVFYDKDLIPENTIDPLSYDSKPAKIDKIEPYTINDVISYYAEYINYNNLGLISDAHSAFCDKEKDGAKSETSEELAKKFSRAVDAPKTGDKVELKDSENPKEFPHFMEKNKNKSYHSKKILGKLYDQSKNMISLRNNEKYSNSLKSSFYDDDLKLNGWENFAFLSLIYYREYFNEMLSMLKKNEISGETVLLTGNNIDNENSVFQNKKHNYDMREKIGYEIHYMFIKNQNNFNNAIYDFFNNNIETNHKKISEKELINISLVFKRNYHLFASACYMITYNLLEEVLNKKINGRPIIDFYCEKLISLINDNFVQDDTFEDICDIYEYEYSNLGIDYTENYEDNYSNIYQEIENQKKLINNKTIDKLKNNMNKFIDELRRIPIPKQANDENQYRILSFPWCISGNILTSIKYIKYARYIFSKSCYLFTHAPIIVAI